MDEVDKQILKILTNYPKGLSYRQIWNKLRDEEGEHLVAFPTLQKRIDQLEKKGYVEVDKSNWKQGRSMIIKLKEDYKPVAERLSKIREHKELFKKYIENQRSKLTSGENILKVQMAETEIITKLENEKEKILNSDMSPDLKKELLFEIIETEKEIEKMLTDLYLEDEHFSRIWSFTNGLSREELEEEIMNILKPPQIPIDEIAERIIKEHPEEFKSKSDVIKFLKRDTKFMRMLEKINNPLQEIKKIREEVRAELKKLEGIK